MDKHETLTNEFVRKKFKSQFELVNYAIKLTEQLIKSGRTPRGFSDNLNPAVIIIEEIEDGKDHLDPILPQEPKAQVEEINQKEQAVEPNVKPAEKKRARRILA